MAPSLGVDHTSEALVVTPPLPAVVLGNAAAHQRTKAKQAWRRQVAQGEVSAQSKPPSAPALWHQFVLPAAWGIVVALFVGLPVDLVADGLGHLFGFQPGHTGLFTGLVAGFLAGFWLLMREETTRFSDYDLVARSQRRLSGHTEWTQLRSAHQEATTVLTVWPELGFDELSYVVTARLRTALWQLSVALEDRSACSRTLRDLRTATTGVPAHTTTARQLAEQIKRADRLHQRHEAEAQCRRDQVTRLAQRCQQFHDEQAAIRRAEAVSQQAYAVLGPVSATPTDHAAEQQTFEAQLAAIREAYDALPETVTLDTPPGRRPSARLFYYWQVPGPLDRPADADTRAR